MKTLIWVVRYLLSGTVIGLVSLDFMSRLYGRKYRRWVDWAILIVFVLLCVAVDFLRSPLYNMAYTFISFFTISYVFYLPHKKKFEYDLVFLLYMTLLDILITPLLASFNEMPIERIMHRPFTAMFYEVITKSALICTYRMIIIWFKRSPIGSIDKRQNLLLLVILLFQMITGNALTSLIDSRKTAFIMAIVGAGFLVMDLYIAYLLDYVIRNQDLQVKMELADQQASLQNQHYREVELLNQQYRAVLHDLRNHLQVLNGLSGSSQQKAYSEQLLHKVEDLKDHKICNEPLLNVILTAKQRAAEAKGIPVTWYIQEADWSKFQEMDLTTVFANLLDNAIEACEALPGPERSIELRVHLFQGFLAVNVRNSFSGSVPPLLKNHAAYSGKKGHWGIGLLNVRDVIEKYGGNMKVSYRENFFEVEIILPTA